MSGVDGRPQNFFRRQLAPIMESRRPTTNTKWARNVRCGTSSPFTSRLTARNITGTVESGNDGWDAVPGRGPGRLAGGLL